MLKIGIQSRGIIKENAIEEGYKTIKSSGITCVDYDILNQKGALTNTQYYQKHIACAKRHEITFAQVHAPVLKHEQEYVRSHQQGYTLEYIVDVLKQSVDICKVLESPFLVVHALNTADKTTKDEEFALNMELFTRVGAYAMEHDVTICIENVPYRKENILQEGACSRAQDIVNYIERLNQKLGHACFGACFDIGHANILKHNFEQEILKLGDYLKVVHIHDNDGARDLHQMPYCFTHQEQNFSNTDWSGFLVALRQIKYRGVLSFETYKLFTSMPGILQTELLKFLYKIGVHFSTVILYEERLKKYKEHTRVVFGAGKMLDVYMKFFGEEYRPHYIVDNNAKLWGTQKYGILICDPKMLAQSEQKNNVVIICSAYYEEIIIQLQSMGINQYELSEEILRMSGKPQ